MGVLFLSFEAWAAGPIVERQAISKARTGTVRTARARTGIESETFLLESRTFIFASAFVDEDDVSCAPR
ncbi:MAG: hypothetical protein BGO98_15425 [Myxococcales bacterium 68-20]|nr:MAG: hypothetical protein BGO98_15425 [Myxococcales bacterium 68-20]